MYMRQLRNVPCRWKCNHVMQIWISQCDTWLEWYWVEKLNFYWECSFQDGKSNLKEKNCIAFENNRLILNNLFIIHAMVTLQLIYQHSNPFLLVQFLLVFYSFISKINFIHLLTPKNLSYLKFPNLRNKNSFSQFKQWIGY